MPEDNYEHLHSNIFYTETNCPSDDIDVENIDSFCSCDAGENCSNDSKCQCLRLSVGKNYNEDNTINYYKKTPFFECNDKCRCLKSSCQNRVVQNGPILGLLKRRFESKGLGLICSTDIAKGQFVCEYAGEIITSKVAQKRSQKDSNNYILYVKEFFKENLTVTIVDPTSIGNIGRYINHSCDPNLFLQPTRVDIMTPRVALFALKNIPSGEELTFDYGNFNHENIEDIKVSITKCLCQSDKCRGFLPHHTFKK